MGQGLPGRVRGGVAQGCRLPGIQSPGYRFSAVILHNSLVFSKMGVKTVRYTIWGNTNENAGSSFGKHQRF